MNFLLCFMAWYSEQQRVGGRLYRERNRATPYALHAKRASDAPFPKRNLRVRRARAEKYNTSTTP